MTCSDAEALVVDAVDGRLDLSAAMRLSAHLEGCASCGARAAEWRQLVPGLRALAPEPPDAMRVRRMQVEIERQLGLGRAPARAAGWRRARGPAGAVILAAAAVFALIWWRHPVAPIAPAGAPGTPAYATVVGVEGAVSDGAHALAPAAALAADSHLALAEGGHAELALARGTRVRIAGPARVVLGGNPRAVALRLEEGTLDAEVAHRLPGETFAVVTPALRVEVRGTHFSVGAGSASWVHVTEGRVDVRLPDGQIRQVSTGETLQSPPSPSPSPSPSPFPSPSPSSSSSPLSPPSAEPTCADLTHTCESLARDARDHMRAGDQSAALHLLSGPRRGARAGRAATPACSTAAVACQDELGYLRAEALRGVGRIDDAIAAYRRLDQRSKPAAMRQNALYAAAEFERRRGHLARARADYERALASAPRGALREEAMLGAMDSAASAGDHAAAKVLARRYLDEFPAGIGAARARGIRDGEAR